MFLRNFILLGPLQSKNHDAVNESSVAFENNVERQQQ